MALLKNLVLAFFVSFAMLATAPSAIAKPAGKVANQTQAEVVASLDDTVTATEAVLTAIQSGAEKDDVMALFKTAKQTAKTIESSVVLAQRDRSLGKLKKARSAYKKGDIEKSEELMVIAIDSFKMTRKKFHDF